MSERAIRTTRIELYKFSPERRAAWLELSREVQRLYNLFWQIWICYHRDKGTPEIVDRFIRDLAAWHQLDAKTRGKKPKAPKGLDAVPKELARRIYHTAGRTCPSINKRTLVLAQQKWRQTLATRKSAHGALSGWMSILLAREGIPSFIHPQPIPFDKENSVLSESDLVLRIERLYLADGQMKKSVVESCQLMLKRRKARSASAVVKKIVSGEYEFRGSALANHKGKWFAMISYKMPKNDRVKLDASRVLHLMPGKRSPWIVAIRSTKNTAWRFGGRGRHVEHARRHILHERSERREHYRWSASNQRHGRKRALATWTKLSSRWRDFAKRYNHQLTRSLIDICLREHVGKVVYHQPIDSRRDDRYLAVAGNTEHGNMTWDWHQVATMLAYKCEMEGIELETKKVNHRVAPSDSVRNVRQDSAPKRRPSRAKKTSAVL